MAQVVEVEIEQTDLFAGLDPDRFVEIRAAQLAALRSDEDDPPLPRLSEPLEVPSDLWAISAGKEIVRLPACDFGVSVRRTPLSGCERVSLLRISHASRSRFSRRSPASSPQRISAKVASGTRAWYRAGTALAISNTTASGTIRRSSDSSLPAPSMCHGLWGMMRSSSAAFSKMACRRNLGKSRSRGGFDAATPRSGSIGLTRPTWEGRTIEGKRTAAAPGQSRRSALVG